ncbi:MAG: hypothetical protein AAF620_19320 [Bacteroidota bacterium]
MSVIEKGDILEKTQEIKFFSFDVKRNTVSEQQRINQFLDAILQLKSNLADRIEKLSKLNDMLESLTWVEGEVGQEELLLINDLISACRDLHSALNRSYASCNSIRGVARNEFKQLKNCIDDFKEVFEDVEAVYFYLPNNQNLQTIFEELKV